MQSFGLIHAALGELRLSIRDKWRKEGIWVIFYNFFPIFSTIVYISYPLKMVSFMVSQLGIFARSKDIYRLETALLNAS